MVLEQKRKNEIPKVVIVGRPNVGKSTLFNRLMGRKRALVHDRPGVTRDVIRAFPRFSTSAGEIDVEVSDTGGIGGKIYDQEIFEKIKTELVNTDVLLMVFDAREGLTSLDRDFLSRLRKATRKGTYTICVLNKVDSLTDQEFYDEFIEVGADEEIQVSSEHGIGISDLKQIISEHLFERGYSKATTEVTVDRNFKQRGPVQIAIMGRPNVGKSTFYNALAGEDLNITSSQAGTTTDQINTTVQMGDIEVEILDTAGIRRKSKTEQGLEVLSVIQAKKAVEKADLALLMIDGVEGPTEQDEKIAGIVEDAHCSVVILVNKWDLRKGKIKEKDAGSWIHEQLGFLNYAPVVFMSALKKVGYENLGQMIEEILDQRSEKISTPELTRFIRSELEKYNPKRARIYTSHFIPASKFKKLSPKLVLQVNDPKKMHYGVTRHLINGVRKRWGFIGTPIRATFKKSGTWKHLAK